MAGERGCGSAPSGMSPLRELVLEFADHRRAELRKLHVAEIRLDMKFRCCR